MAEALETGLTLMATGMGTVFVLLAVLVAVVRGVSALSRRLDGASKARTMPSTESVIAPATDAEIIPIVSAAIAAFRRDRHR